MKVWVEEEIVAGTPYIIYRVWVGGKVYDEMTLKKGPGLTASQQLDIANGYREALEGYGDLHKD